MAKARRGKSTPVDTRETDRWLEGERAIPRADLETPDARRGRQRFFRVYVYSAAALFPLTLLGHVSLLPGWFAAQDATLAANHSAETSHVAKQAAMQAVQDWLGSDPVPVPGGHIVSYDGVANSVPSTETGSGDNVQILPGYEVHTFTIGSGGTARFTANLQVSVDEALGVFVQGTPSLEPIVPSALAAAEPWPGAAAGTASEEVVQAVAAWAEAYTGGDPDRLRLLTGDPDPEHSYQPMTGATGMANVAVGAVSPRSDGLTVVRATFTPLWDAPAPLTDDPAAMPSDPAAAPPVTYDVLVDRADTAAPVVVAWGGPGGVDDLQAFGNALVGIDLTQAGGEVVDPEEAQAALEAAEAAGAPAEDTENEGN